MNFLLDTCILSEFTKPQPNEGLLQWMVTFSENSFFISVLTVGELKKGIERLAQSKKKGILEKWLENELRPRFAERTIPINDAVALEWGKMLAENEKKGRTLPTVDSLIAASARTFGLVLVTRNENDFKEAGIQILNPFRCNRQKG